MQRDCTLNVPIVQSHFVFTAPLSIRLAGLFSFSIISMTIEHSNHIHIAVRPAKLTPSGQRYEARCGKDIIATSRTPFLAAARALIDRGHSPDMVLTMSHEGDNTDSLRSTLGAAAGLRVVENDTAGPRFGRYRPPPAEGGFPVVTGRARTAGSGPSCVVLHETAGAAL